MEIKPSQRVREIARVCHEVSRAICEAGRDASQKPWHEAEQWQRDRSIKGVSFVIAHPDGTPTDQHAAWCRYKIADGWKYGPVEDAEAKTHPYLVPYDDLPFEQRVKDHAFRAVVRAMSRFHLFEVDGLEDA